MKKYDLSKIMKRAWEIVRKLKNSFAQALRMSWQIAKMELSLREDYDRFDSDDKVTFNIWEGYAKLEPTTDVLGEATMLITKKQIL